MGSPTPEWSSTVGPYRLVRRLGAGGMGVVYLGHHQRTGATAAVKLIRPEHAADPESRARLRREVAAAQRVPRFCTAPVLDADLDGDPPWVATEYVDGASLDTVVLVQGRLAGGALEHLAVGVAMALRAIHQHHVIHRDLKPSNILLSAVGPRVIDFGIARLADQADLTQLTQAGTVIGTPSFMAPEQLNGEPLTTAVDVFGWAGVVTYAATGQPPFGTGVAAMPAILHGQPNLGDLPEPLRRLVAAAFAKDPAARPSAADLVDDLTRVASATTSHVIAAATASPSGAVSPATPPAQLPAAATPSPVVPAPAGAASGRTFPRRRMLVAAAIAVLAAVTMTAVLLTRGGLLPLPEVDAASPGGEAAVDSTLTLGGLMPVQGPFAEIGVGMIAAAQLAVEEINTAGGVWGNDVVWVLEDEGQPGNPAQAATAGDALIARGVNAVIGGYADSASLAVLEAMHREKIIMVSPANTGAELTGHQFGEYYFRTAASVALQANALAELILAEGHATLAILAEQSSYGQGVAAAIERTYQDGGGQVVYQEFHELPQHEYADEVAGLLEANPAAFVLISSFTDETVIRALVTGGFSAQQTQWYLTGLGLTDYRPYFEDGTLAGVKVARQLADEEPIELMARVDDFAGGVPFPYLVPESYDAVMVVALAAFAASSDDPDAIKDEMVGVTTGGTPCTSFAGCTQLLAGGDDIAYRGYTDITWNQHGEPAEASIGIFQFLDDNTFEQVDVVVGRL